MRSTVKKHFDVASQADVGLIVQVKSNQPTLLQTIAEITDTAEPIGCCRTRDDGRSRFERRTMTVVDPADKLANTDCQDHVRAIVRVERIVDTRCAKTGLLRGSTESAYYVCNQSVSADRAAEAIRAHWRVETTFHYSRDVTLGEDASRIRCNPGIFARRRRFAFNILKANQTGTLPQDRYRAVLGGLEALANFAHV